MCDPDHRVKLCTCSGPGPIKRPYWTLTRRDPDDIDDDIRAVGSIEVIDPPFEEAVLTAKLRDDLNRFDAFDTDMGLTEGDVLDLALETMDLTFEFTEGRLQSSDGFPPRHSRGDLVGTGGFRHGARFRNGSDRDRFA
ncbi:hypothetical protein SAMN05444413_104116 [Roseivivax marinus]|uniref:hypothetical protein n=1 Tax=Roseivivax marinus TaxID=1379903 RepID=UPI0008CA96FA|nr:hypothetical protein [Roseivivax marinus]SEK89800.1 hypothetical protein SAMN05444413_104116 [Roseivivax marinus]